MDRHRGLHRDEIPNGIKSAEALREELAMVREELRRKQSTLDDMLESNVHARAQLRHTEKLVAVKKKPKGKVDALGWRYVKSQILYQIVNNCLSLPVVMIAAIQAGEYTHFLLLQALMNAVIPPVQVYLQKRAEVH